MEFRRAACLREKAKISSGLQEVSRNPFTVIDLLVILVSNGHS